MPDQTDRLEELRVFLSEHNRLPRQHEESERSLGTWMYAQRPESRKKGSPSHARCVEVQKLIAPYRGKPSPKKDRLATVKKFVEEHGHLPRTALMEGLHEHFVGVPTLMEHRREQRFLTVRACIESTGTLPPPSKTDPIWSIIYQANRGQDPVSTRIRNLVKGVPVEQAERSERRTTEQRMEDLKAYIAEHGTLPSQTTDGNLYRWMYYASKRDDAVGEILRTLMKTTPRPTRGRPKKENEDDQTT